MDKTLRKPIFVIGGMGPQASANLLNRLVDKAIQTYSVVDNIDFPHIIVESLNVPDFISSRDNEATAIVQMKQAAHHAQSLNTSVVGMSCNTAHVFMDEMLADVDIPFISLIDTVADRVVAQNITNIALLASPTTIKSKLYERAFKERNITCLLPTVAEQDILEDTIRSVIAGTATKTHAAQLLKIAERLVAKGAQAIVLGCTELPLIFPKQETEQSVFDCLDVLADELLKRYYDQ